MITAYSGEIFFSGTWCFGWDLSALPWQHGMKNTSILIDLKILFLTFGSVMRQKGVIADQDVNEIDDIGLYDNSIGIDHKM